MDGNVIDLEGQSLNIVQIPDGVAIKTLILDNNNISKLENLDKCTELSQVRICSLSIYVWLSYKMTGILIVFTPPP